MCLVIILLFIFIIKGEITGESITGQASNRPVNVSLFIAPITNNSAPILGPINNSIFICERAFLNYPFNATDVDGDDLEIHIAPPTSPFYLNPSSFTNGETHINANIISGVMSKAHIGSVNTGSKLYEIYITITDGYNSTCCSDTAITNISVIEINNDPIIENIGVQTIWSIGENSTFYKELSVTDTEYNLGFGTLDYNISITNSSEDSVNLFNISSIGIMNFTADLSTILGVYNITICVNDSGLTSTHTNISELCGQDGSSRTACTNFSLTITNENRAPNIIDHYPNNLTINTTSTNALEFNITKNDPDLTIPDTYWYVDNGFVEYDSGNSIDEFNYNFGCGISGDHTIKAEITDGELNNSAQWNITVSYIACSIPTTPGGGGGVAIQPKNFSIDKTNIGITLRQGQSKLETITITNNEKNNLSFSISSRDLEKFIVISQENFKLEPGEQKKIIIDFTAQENTIPNIYLGKIFVDAGGTRKEIPVTIEVETKTPLFDVEVKILEEFLPLTPGKNVIANITVFSLEETNEKFNVLLEYAILDETGKEIFLDKEIITLQNKISFLKSFKIPKDLEFGKYILYVKVLYEGQIGSSSDDFFLSPLEKPYPKLVYMLAIIIPIVFMIILITLLLIEKRKQQEFQENHYND